MKHIVRSTIFYLLIACISKHELKISANKKKMSSFIEKYQDSILAAPDSMSKAKIFMNMWKERVKYIQDPFKITTIPTDTFIFKKAIVSSSINQKDGKEDLLIVLHNRNYYSTEIYTDITDIRTEHLHQSAMYRMAKNLRENTPVKIMGNVMGMSLRHPNVDKGKIKVMLDIRIDTVFNAY